MSYSDSRFLKELLKDADLEYVVPCSGPWHTLLFALDSLSDTKYYLIFAWSRTSNLNFYVKKTGSFQIIQCAISPDESRIVILCSKSQEDGCLVEDFSIQVYSKRPAAYEVNFYGNMFELEQEILGIHGYSGPPKLLFDTRFMASRFVLVNVKSIQWNTVSSFICSLDISKGRMITPSQESNSIFSDCSFVDSSYSTDGLWILINVLKDIWVSTVATERGRAIVFVHPDTLEAHKCIDIGWDSLQDCWTNYIPSFSRDCQQVALRYKKYTRVYRLPRPNTLQELCRIVIRNCLNDNEIQRISAGKRIVNYLLYRAIQH